MRILLVEDFRSGTTAFGKELKKACSSFQITQIEHLSDAHEIFKSEKFDLILIDPYLSGSTGFSFIRDIHKKAPQTPIIIVIGSDDEDLGFNAIHAGAHDFIVRTHADAKTIFRSIRYATERHRLLTELGSLRQVQKLEVLGQLAGGVAHDFNNLLTVIKGYTELSLHELDPHGKTHKSLKEVQKAADRAAYLTRQLLSFGRPRAWSPHLIDLNHTLSEMNKALLQLIGEDVELITERSSEPAYVYIDPTQMEQVIINMAVNARHAMPEGGKLTLKTSSEKVRQISRKHSPELLPGDYIVLHVSDNGIGMSDEICKRIFEPFFTTKPAGKGTGLGLTTCYGVIKQSGGHIEVKSRIGAGTVFSIYLPRAEPKSTHSEPPREIQTHFLGTETILMVEDEKPILEMARQYLSRMGYKILTAPNGIEALELLHQYDEKIDLMITDVVMPKMGGPELVQSIPPLRSSMKVIYMAGHNDNQTHQKLLQNSPYSLIPKPFSLHHLSAKVREALHAHSKEEISKDS